MLYSEQIAFLLEAESGELSWAELARKYGYSCGASASRSYKRLKARHPNLVLKSVWQQHSKKDGTKWLASYKAEESEFLSRFEELKKEFLSDINDNSPRYSHKNKSGKYLLEIAIPDFHFGKYNSVETLKDQADKFINSSIGLYEKAASKYDLDLVLFPIGNDFINSDTLLYTTTKGTPQHDNASWKETFRTSWESVVKVIDYIASNHNVHVPIVQGNHDYQKMFFLGDVLYNRYHKSGNIVVVDNSMNQRKYFSYHKNLFGYTHGNAEKHADLPILMATEQPTLFAECPNRYFRLGHLHRHIHTESFGVGITVLPSLSKPDEWLKNQGYNININRCQGYIFDKEKGLDSYTQYSE